MDEWVKRALAKWPDVPALYGWLRLTRRGRWLIKDELISNPKIIRVINRNYGADEQGRWFFQNGPQRGYIALDYAPFVLRSMPDGGLQTHSELRVQSADTAWLDEEGSLVLATEYGAGLVSDNDLGWGLSRLRMENSPVTEEQLGEALALSSGEKTGLRLHAFAAELPVIRCDTGDMQQRLGFVRNPVPLPQEQD